jgi:hypothetical protein
MSEVAPATTPSGPSAGWYDDPDGSARQRWYDGTTWTDHFQSATATPSPATEVHPTGPMTSKNLNVKREVIYNREQKGHSIVKHLLLGMFVLWVNVIYISVSPNHYWHT